MQQHRNGGYWAPEHMRPGDMHFFREMDVKYLRILDPDIFQIHTAHLALPNAEINPRLWWLDDGNRHQNWSMEQDPIGTANRHAEQAGQQIEKWMRQADERGLKFPPFNKLVMSGVNEPDSRSAPDQIRRYTERLVIRAGELQLPAFQAFNFSTGHPEHVHEGWRNWKYFLEIEPVLQAHNSIINVHEYGQDGGPWHVWKDENGEVRIDWKNLCGRVLALADQTDLRIVIGEWGFDGKLFNKHPHHVGYRGLGISSTQYAQHYRDYHNAVSHAVYAICPFITDYRDNGWKTFDTEPSHAALQGVKHQLNVPPPVDDPKPPAIDSEPPVDNPIDVTNPIPSGDRIIDTLATLLNIQPKVMQAIIDVESGGAAFYMPHVPTSRFELHVFRDSFVTDNITSNLAFRKVFRFRDGIPSWHGYQHEILIGDNWVNIHDGQRIENIAIERATEMNEELGYRATSMGVAQIMGFNYHKCGYRSATEMYHAFSAAELPQLIGFVFYVLNTPGCLQALHAGDYLEFAKLYNGPGQPDYYANLISQAIDK